MIVGILVLDLTLQDNHSLKDKRKVIKSIMARVKAKFNCSCAEVNFQDIYDKSRLGFSMCGSDARVLNQALDYLLNFIEENVEAEICNSQILCERFLE